MNEPRKARTRIIPRGARTGRRGMSLVEVMVVIAIILTIMGILAYGVMTVFGQSQVETTKLQMGRIQERVLIYTVKSKKPPSTAEGLAAVYGDEPVPKDSWGNEFLFISPGPDGSDYDIISYGRDGVEGGTGTSADIHLSDLQN